MNNHCPSQLVPVDPGPAGLSVNHGRGTNPGFNKEDRVMAKDIDNQHWVREDYKERITAKEWEKMLLESDDTIVFKGRVRRLIGKNLGFGVIEISKGGNVTDEKH